MKKTIVIFEISTPESVKKEFLTIVVDFRIGSTFPKVQGPLFLSIQVRVCYKVCHGNKSSSNIECTVTVVMYVISVEKLKNTWRLYMGYGKLAVLDFLKKSRKLTWLISCSVDQKTLGLHVYCAYNGIEFS